MRTPARSRGVAWAVLVTFSASIVACGPSAEESPPTTTVPATTATTEALSPTTIPAPQPTPETQPPEQLGREALRDLVAPVALYPDVVLASLLPATTFPEQVREAARLLGPGGTVERIPDDRAWDGSVLGLLQFPDVLRWLDANPDWMDEMGQAVTYQQGDVLEAIQDYRRLARQAGNLESNRYQKVVQTRAEAPIRIEPARPDIVYVPSYDPAAAVQPQPTQPSGVNPWIAFGAGAAVGALGAWALYSIFDDDEKVVHHYHHGGRRIRRYDDYYFARASKRPPRRDWQPGKRPYRALKRHGTRPGRLEHGPAPTRPSRPLVPPAARPSSPRQERRHERREAQREQRLQRQERQREQRQQRQERRQERREAQREQRLQRQERQREQRQQRQERRQEQRRERQQLRQQRPERPRAQRREQRRQSGGQRAHRRRGRNP